MYKKYDLIINIDGKSLEDIPTVQKNLNLKISYKRISQAVEIQSGTIFNISAEKSHNKSNSFLIIKQIVETAKGILGKNIKILFITNAGSEYLNNRKLRGLFIANLDTSKICEYLKKQNYELLITRFKQDNGYIENKNKYIELACLDNYEIQKMNNEQFIEELQEYIDLSNNYLVGSNKFVYRGKNQTPKQNLQKRFGKQKTEKLLKYLLATQIESIYNLKNSQLETFSLFSQICIISHYITIAKDGSFIFKKMSIKSLDSPIFSCLIEIFLKKK